jgi:hypothetical protein
MEDYLFGIRIFRALEIAKQKQSHTLPSHSSQLYHQSMAKSVPAITEMNFKIFFPPA